MTTLSSLIQAQLSTLRLFLSTESTRTPTILLLIASFGSSLHHPVTTSFYLAIIGESPSADTSLSIGTLGFIQGLGGTIGAPLVGWVLDKYGPYLPIVVTATACSLGCLWRGFAKNLTHLQMGAVLNGVGVNLWTVVLGHLVKSFPSDQRSQVLSGIGVQLAVVQIAGKLLFPFIEYALKNLVGVDEDLIRYRMHMGVCTVFCFYGTVALFWDRRNIAKGKNSSREQSRKQLKEKQSDIFENLEGGISTVNDNTGIKDKLSLSDNGYLYYRSNSDSDLGGTVEMVEAMSSTSTAISSPGKEIVYNQHQPLLAANENQIINNTQSTETSNQTQFISTTVLSIALLLQSLSNTILTVLWPILIHDRFHLTAQTFGVLTFISSMTSMGAMASFPLIERKVGRVRCTASGFLVAAILGILFCICSFREQNVGSRLLVGSNSSSLFGKADILDPFMSWQHRNDSEVDINNSLLIFFEDYSVEQEVNNSTIIRTSESNKRMNKITHESSQTQMPYLLHAISAIAFQASLSFLEPSLKSILSLASSHSMQELSQKSSLGSIMGFMTTIANLGGMSGNVAGTWMYKLSLDLDSSSHSFFREGSLPFFASAVLLGIASFFIWRLEEPIHQYSKIEESEPSHPNESHIPKSEEEPRSGGCLGMRERDEDNEFKSD